MQPAWLSEIRRVRKRWVAFRYKIGSMFKSCKGSQGNPMIKIGSIFEQNKNYI